MTENELLRIIAFLERVRLPFQELIPIAEEDATWNMLLYLIKNHLTGKAGNDDEAARVDRLGVARLDVGRDRGDAVALDQHRAARQLAERGMHGDDAGVAQ